VDSAGARKQRRRLLPARLVVYFVLPCGCSGEELRVRQVMPELADGLYSRRLGADCWRASGDGDAVDAGQGREWVVPNVSSLSRGRAKPRADVHRYLFRRSQAR